MGGRFYLYLLYIHIKVKLSSLYFESFSSFIKYNVSIVFSFICHYSYYLVGSSWLLQLLDRWWDQLGRVDGGVSLQELMVSSWKGVVSSLRDRSRVEAIGNSTTDVS